MPITSIFQTLKALNLSSHETRFVFNRRTRDREDLVVWKDRLSGVIYIDDFYAGDDIYSSSSYKSLHPKSRYELFRDCERRVKALLPFASGKSIVDFGCGEGLFLQKILTNALSVAGVELQEQCLKNLNSIGIRCETSLDAFDDEEFDLLTSFHVLEHLPDPIKILTDMKSKIKPDGMLIFEVPHANDFLLSSLTSEEFKQFTLWSPHLVLHTRRSLQVLFEYCGFEVLEIKGIQRYSVSNHLHWLSYKKPGGHLGPLAFIDTPNLAQAYQESLSTVDANDTLMALVRPI